MREFNSLNWREFQVTKPEQVPKDPHYQVVVFSTRSERDSYDGCYTVPDVKLLVFKDRESLNLCIKELTVTGTSFVFYSVSSLGKASIQVDVNVGID